VKVLALGAHPSDLVHLCGGTLAKYAVAGHQVTLVALCAGDSAFAAFSPELEAARVKEFTQVAAVIGAGAQWLASPDFSLRDEPHCRLRLVELIRRTAPDVIVTHAPEDYCRDHAVIGELAGECTMMARQPGVRTESSCLSVHPFVVHTDTVSGLGFVPEEFVDITEVMGTKRSMVKRFELELAAGRDNPVVEPMEWLEIAARFRGIQCGCGTQRPFDGPTSGAAWAPGASCPRLLCAAWQPPSEEERMAEQAAEPRVCETCGATTTGAGHLCRPFPLVSPYKCEYCGAETDDPRHMCYPQIEHLRFQCLHCGRLAARSGALCHPKRIAGT
jgi:LmbE family N-acetylglucosaminyl deacetylase